MPVMNIGPVPQSHDGFYATNNPCHVSGPKGFTEFEFMEGSEKKINIHVPSSCFSHLINGYNSEEAEGHPLAHLRGLNPEGRLGTDPLDPAFTGPVTTPHPSVMEGSTSAYESKRLPNGGLFLRIDMPGVPNNHFTVTLESDGGITVIGRAPPTMYDSSGREYRGKVAVVPQDYDSRRIKVIPKHGVISLIIPPF